MRTRVWWWICAKGPAHWTNRRWTMKYCRKGRWAWCYIITLSDSALRYQIVFCMMLCFSQWLLEPAHHLRMLWSTHTSTERRKQKLEQMCLCCRRIVSKTCRGLKLYSRVCAPLRHCDVGWTARRLAARPASWIVRWINPRSRNRPLYWPRGRKRPQILALTNLQSWLSSVSISWLLPLNALHVLLNNTHCVLPQGFLEE